jgi:hypothetical protein
MNVGNVELGFMDGIDEAAARMCMPSYYVLVAAVLSLMPWWNNEDLFLSFPVVTTYDCGGIGVRLKMTTLKHGRWSMDGGSGIISRLD